MRDYPSQLGRPFTTIREPASMRNQENLGGIMKGLLDTLDLGSSVAEFDKDLERYFVENDAFYALVRDQADIVAGDKGSGKTALYKIIQQRQRSIESLKNVELIAGFNPAGNPVFQQLTQHAILSEAQYASVWKTYVVSLVGNWLLQITDETDEPYKKLGQMLSVTGLRSGDDKPAGIFSRLVSFIFPKSTEVKVTFSESGIPIVSAKLEHEKNGSLDSSTQKKEVRHEDALRLLDDCLADLDLTAWIALDRLDEAFQGSPEIEIPALRALFRTYLDLLEFKNLRLKLFVRRDLFRRIVGDGFVNLTHINAKKVEITWDEEDLRNLLCKRIRDSASVVKEMKLENLSDDELFHRVFPAKVDQAEKKPTTWRWVVSRIRDGNNVMPPRNLIDLAKFAREEQSKSDARSPREPEKARSLIEADAVKKAFRKLSESRVIDTLLAEAGAPIKRLIEQFRRSKAEHNQGSLEALLKVHDNDLLEAIRRLSEVGFLEEVKATSTWKVPMLYRDGLEITQGKAFDTSTGADDEADA